MQQPRFRYFQFRKQFDYPVFLRFRDDELDAKFSHLVKELGFNELTEVESKKVLLRRDHTKMLTIQFASTRINQQMTGSDLDQYGSEVLSLQGGVPVYTYRKVGIMALPSHKTLWDLALHSDFSHTDQMVGLRVILVRYLAQALSDFGVLSYWGTVKDDSVFIMKQGLSFGEAVFIDWTKKMIFSNGGEVKLGSHLKIVRKDKPFSSSGTMDRYELISFLSVSTCLLGFRGITNPMKRAIIELSANVSGSFFLSESHLNL